jgi:hypothetical protein
MQTSEESQTEAGDDTDMSEGAEESEFDEDDTQDEESEFIESDESQEEESECSEEETIRAERICLEKNRKLKKISRLNLSDCKTNWQYKKGLHDLACALAGRLGTKHPSLVATEVTTQTASTSSWASRYTKKKTAPPSCYLLGMVEELDEQFNITNDLIDLKPDGCKRLIH